MLNIPVPGLLPTPSQLDVKKKEQKSYSCLVIVKCCKNKQKNFCPYDSSIPLCFWLSSKLNFHLFRTVLWRLYTCCLCLSTLFSINHIENLLGWIFFSIFLGHLNGPNVSIASKAEAWGMRQLISDGMMCWEHTVTTNKTTVESFKLLFMWYSYKRMNNSVINLWSDVSNEPSHQRRLQA